MHQSRVCNLIIDSHDLETNLQFWSAALGVPHGGVDGPGDRSIGAVQPAGGSCKTPAETSSALPAFKATRGRGTLAVGLEPYARPPTSCAGRTRHAIARIG